MAFIFLGGIIGIIGTAMVVIATLAHNRSSSEKTNSIKSTSEHTNTMVISLKEENEGLRKQIDSLTDNVVTLTKQNVELSDKLTEKTVQIFDHQTGGESFVYLQIQPMNDDNAKLYIFNDGNNPMYDVEFRLNDMSFIFPENRDASGRTSSPPVIYNMRSVGNIPPKQMKDLGVINGDFKTPLKFFVFDINARNGYLHQETRLKREPLFIDGKRAWPDKWLYVTSVSRDQKIVYRSSNLPPQQEDKAAAESQ